MEKWEGKVAVVTGASVGIGAALCRALVEAGMVVCGMSKRKDKMEVSLKVLKSHENCRSVKVQIFNQVTSYISLGNS